MCAWCLISLDDWNDSLDCRLMKLRCMLSLCESSHTLVDRHADVNWCVSFLNSFMCIALGTPPFKMKIKNVQVSVKLKWDEQSIFWQSWVIFGPCWNMFGVILTRAFWELCWAKLWLSWAIWGQLGPSWDHLGKTRVCHFGGVMIGRLTSMAALAYLTYIASRTHDRFLQVRPQSAWQHSTAAMVLNTSWNNRLCDLVLCWRWHLFSFKGFVVMFG